MLASLLSVAAPLQACLQVVRPQARVAQLPHEDGKSSSKSRQSSDSEGSSSGSEAPKRSVAAPTTAPTKDKLRVCHRHSKPCTCCLCGARSVDASPLSEPGDPLPGGMIPRGKYRTVKTDEDLFRVLEGRINLICVNVYRALGVACISKVGSIRGPPGSVTIHLPYDSMNSMTL